MCSLESALIQFAHRHQHTGRAPVKTDTERGRPHEEETEIGVMLQGTTGQPDAGRGKEMSFHTGLGGSIARKTLLAFRKARE